MSRSDGSMSLTTRSPMRISPDEVVSTPAIMRSSVDLPQPDGADQHAEVPVRHVQGNALHGFDAAGVDFSDVFQCDLRHQVCPQGANSE
jgi:hypothetical protein